MKSLYYVAQITRLYRAAHDADPQDQELMQKLTHELDNVSHRSYWDGFYDFSDPGWGISQEKRSYSSKREYIGKIIAHSEDRVCFDALAKIEPGDRIEVIYPNIQDDISMIVNQIYDNEDNVVSSTRPNYRYSLRLEHHNLQGGLIRKCVESS